MKALACSIDQPILVKQLHEEFTKLKINLWGNSDLAEFQNIIAKLNFNKSSQEHKSPKSEELSQPTNTGSHLAPNIAPQVSPSQSNSSAIWNEEQFCAALDSIRDFSNEINLFRQKNLNASCKYFFFAPALEIEEALQRDFDNDSDPALIIANYLKAFFSKPEKSTPLADIASIPATIELLQLILEIVSSLPNTKKFTFPSANQNTSLEAITHGIIYLLSTIKSDSSNGNSSEEEVEQIDGSDEEESDDLSHDNVDFLKLLSRSASFTQDFFDSILKHSENRIRWNYHALLLLALFPFEKKYKDISEFKSFCGDNKEIADLFEHDGESTVLDLPIVRWSQIKSILDDFDLYISSNTEGDLGAAIHLIGKKYEEYRRTNGGYSPLSIEDSSNLCSSIEWYLPRVTDPVLALSKIYFSSWSSFDEFGCHWLFEEQPRDILDHLKRRSRLYLSVSEHAYQQGFYEFGSALLGFFIYSQRLISEDSILVDFPKLSELINVGIQNQGKEIIENCISKSVSTSSDTTSLIDTIYLSSFIKHRRTPHMAVIKTDKIPPLPPEKVILRSNLHSKLPLVFEKFCKEAIDLLVDAELMWKKYAEDYGHGGISNWGALGIALSLPIEVELVCRLKEVFNSDEYRHFHKAEFKREAASKTTLGAIVHMLKAHKKLPAPILKSIEHSGIRLPINTNVIRELENVQRFRNSGAHAEPFTEEDYLKLRKTLFETGLNSLAESLTKSFS